MSQEIMNLIRRHCATLKEEFAEADAKFRALSAGGSQAEIDAVTAQAHKIKGSSGTLGFGAISRRAEEYEHALRCASAGHLTVQQKASLGQMHDSLGRTIADIAPEQSALYQRFQSQVGS